MVGILYLQQMQSSSEENALNLPQDEEQDEAMASLEIGQVPIQSFEELPIIIDEDITRKFRPLLVIHETANSVVVKCMRSQHEKETGCSEMRPDEMVIIKFTPLANREGEFLRMIHENACPHILKSLDIFKDALVLEYCNGSLRDLIYRYQNLESSLIIKMLDDCRRAFSRLNQLGIIHSDVKPSNILYQLSNTEIGKFLLADFANSLAMSSRQQVNKDQQVQDSLASWQYTAPEILSSPQEVTSKIDMWGLGCVLFECMTGETLLPAETDPKSYHKYLVNFATEQQIMKRLKRFSYPSQIQKFKDLLFSLLKFDPAERLSWAELEKVVSQLILV